MLIEHVTLFEETISVSTEEVDFEEVEAEDVGPDPRLAGLSPETRRVIDRLFDGDVDEAVYTAARVFPLYRNPPRWVTEIHGGARRGWRDPNRVRC